MPVYDLKCKCDKVIEDMFVFSEKERIKCPGCRKIYKISDFLKSPVRFSFKGDDFTIDHKNTQKLK